MTQPLLLLLLRSRPKSPFLISMRQISLVHCRRLRSSPMAGISAPVLSLNFGTEAMVVVRE